MRFTALFLPDKNIPPKRLLLYCCHHSKGICGDYNVYFGFGHITKTSRIYEGFSLVTKADLKAAPSVAAG